MDAEAREKLDTTLKAFERLEERVYTPTDQSVSKPKKVPSWWRGEEAASASSIQAARDLGYVVGASS